MHPLLSGVLATVLAVVQLFGWLAIGSMWPRTEGREHTAPALALLVGSAATALLYAVAASVGLVRSGMAAAIMTTL